MPWFKVDDQLHAHTKWRAVPKSARALWTTAGSWCASQGHGGHVPAYMLGMLDGRPADARALVSVGLWEEGDDGWWFHDWEDFQPSAEQVEEQRRKEREKKRAQRAKSSRNGTGQFSSHGVSPGDSAGDEGGTWS